MSKLLTRTALVGLVLTSVSACHMQDSSRMYGEDRYQYDKRFNCPLGHSYRGNCNDMDYYKADIYLNNDQQTYGRMADNRGNRVDNDGRMYDSNTRTLKNDTRPRTRY